MEERGSDTMSMFVGTMTSPRHRVRVYIVGKSPQTWRYKRRSRITIGVLHHIVYDSYYIG